MSSKLISQRNKQKIIKPNKTNDPQKTVRIKDKKNKRKERREENNGGKSGMNGVKNER